MHRQQFGGGNDRLSLTDYVSNQKTYYADGAVEYTEFGGNGILVWTKSLIYFGGSVLSTITPNGQGGEYTEYHHPDRLGTRLVTNQPGGTSHEQVHLPFGNGLDAESTGATGRRFTSYERSARTGLDYAQNRTYDPKQGRFTQVDPIAMGSVELSNPQTLNLYAYCTNDPVNYVDPSGLGFFSFLKKLFKWVMVAIAVIVAVITIIAAPATIAGVLGAISAASGAVSSVAGALGYNKVARIFGLIAVITGFGSVMAAKLGVGDKLFGFAVAKEGTSKLFSPWTGVFLGAGSISNSFTQPKKQKARSKGSCPKFAAQVYFGTNAQFDVYEEALNRSRKHGHEEGGWIYQNSRGDVKAVLKDRDGIKDPNDGSIHINLNNPRSLKGWKVAGTFHTHDVDLGPSGEVEDLGNGKIKASGDYLADYSRGTPGMVLTRTKGGGQGYYIYGPPRGFLNQGVPADCK